MNTNTRTFQDVLHRGVLALVGTLAMLSGLMVPAGTAGAAGPQALPPATPEERAAAMVRPAEVYVESHWSAYVFDDANGVNFNNVLNNGDPFELTASCSGFVVNPAGSIITAGHCVDPGRTTGGIGVHFVETVVDGLVNNDLISASQTDRFVQYGLSNWRIEGQNAGAPPDRQVYVQWGVAQSGLTSGQAQQARVLSVASLDAGDVALLKVEQDHLPSVLLAPTSAIEIGTPVLSVGYPGSTADLTDKTLEPAFKDGKISAKRTVNGVPFYEMSAAMTEGDSGGMVVDTQGRVVGLNSWTPSGEQQAFNYIAPASMIHEVLDRQGVKNEVGPADLLYRQGLDRYFKGDYAAAIKSFDKVLALVPSHQQAQELRQKAAEHEGTASGQSSSSLLIIAVAGGAALLVAAGLLVAVARRRAKRATPVPPSDGSGAGIVSKPRYTGGPQLGPNGRVVSPAATRAGLAREARGSATTTVADAPARQVSRFCMVCGEQRQPGQQFCGACGERVA